MAVNYSPTGSASIFAIPDYPEAADGPQAFKAYSDQVDSLLPPVGCVLPYVGSSSPTGWLVCDGSEYLTAAYPTLAAMCSTLFGTASVAGKFKVPDLRGKSVFGRNVSDSTMSTIGASGGSKTFTLTTSNMPAHTHTATSAVTVAANGDHTHNVNITGTSALGGAHGHNFQSPAIGDNFTRSGSGDGRAAATTTAATTAEPAHSHGFTVSGATVSNGSHAHTATATVTVANAGSGADVTHISPFLALNFIIRAA